MWEKKNQVFNKLYIYKFFFFNSFKQLGMGSAVETLCGQAYGAQKYEMLGVYLQRSTVLLTLVGVLLSIIYIFSKPILIFLGQSPEIASAAAVFVYGLIPQIFAYAVNFPIQKFLQAQSIVTPSAYISAATLVTHLLLTWVAVYKIRLGLLGASLVLSFSWWIIVAAQFVYIVKSERCKKKHVERVLYPSFLGLGRVLQVVCGICCDALPGDVVLSDSCSAGWFATKP